mgnify:CR=1 FL=1
MVAKSKTTSSGSDAATASSTSPTAGNLPTPNGVVPLAGAVIDIADVDKCCPDVNLISLLTILTVTFF